MSKKICSKVIFELAVFSNSKLSIMESSENNKQATKVHHSLQDCFKKIIDGLSVEVDVDNAEDILKSNLLINVNSLKPKLRSVLPYMLIRFIKSWPGWQKSKNYFNKQITFESWFTKFKEYLLFKLNYLIKNFESMLKSQLEIPEDYLYKIDGNTQTVPLAEKSCAPYVLEIQGPPRILNSLVFQEGQEGSINLKEYKVTTAWTEMLSIRQLINWPCIEIKFEADELYFKRTNVHDFKRFLTFSTEKLFFNKPDIMIEEVDIIDDQNEREAYTLNAIKEYCNLYISLLRKNQNLLAWTNRQLDHIETILEDFILDIVDINMNSMATNTRVLFNIGNSIYARNKSIKTSQEAVCLTDSITPKTQLSLIRFTAMKDSDEKNPFPRLNQLLNDPDNGALSKYGPKITFTCTYCEESASSQIDIWKHLRFQHNMEQPVLCFRCKQQFKITDLTGNRWRHECNTKGNQNR